MKISIAIKDGESLKRIPTSNDDRGEKYFAAAVKANTLMREGSILEQWKDVNPRAVDLGSQACRSMEASLLQSPSEFVYLNKGLLILAKTLTFNQANKSIDIELTDKQLHGLADGGHTFASLKKFIATTPDDNRVEIRIDFIVGVNDRERVIEITNARNTSAQVKDLSIMNMDGKFDQIKRELIKYEKLIAYKENDREDENEEKKPVSVREIISYLMCFDVDTYPINEVEKQPIQAYSGKAATLNKYDGKYEEISRKYAPLLPKIVELRDVIYKEFPTISPKLKNIKNNSTDKPIITEGKTTELYFANILPADHSIFEGLYFPILAAFRALIRTSNGVAVFNQDPIELFEKIKGEFAPVITIGLDESDNNPQTFGKKKSVWVSCLEVVNRHNA